MTSEQLKLMSQMTFEDVAGDELIGLGTMRFDMNQPPDERIKKLLQTEKNPYFRKTEDGTVVKISFSNNGRSFEENMVNLISG